MYETIGTSHGIYKRGLTKDGIHPNLKASDLMTAAAEQQLPTAAPGPGPGSARPVGPHPLNGGKASR